MSLGDKSNPSGGKGGDGETSHHPNQETLPSDDQNSANEQINNGASNNQSEEPAAVSLEDGSHIVHINEDGCGSDSPAKCDDHHSLDSADKEHSNDQATSSEGNGKNVHAKGGDGEPSHRETQDNHNSDNHLSHQSCSKTQHHVNNENSCEPNSDIQESSSTEVPNLEEVIQSIAIGDDDTPNSANERKDISELKITFILIVLIVAVGTTIYFTLPKRRNKDWF